MKPGDNREKIDDVEWCNAKNTSSYYKSTLSGGDSGIYSDMQILNDVEHTTLDLQ